jgi:hypothetical protein
MARALILLAVSLLTIPLLPLGGAVDPVETDAAVPLELKGVAPDWWTPEVREAADRAALEGELLNPLTGETYTPQEAAVLVQIPVGAPDYLFIRPGALALSEAGALCTYNFIYNTKTQIGLAGHCVERNGEPVYILAAPGPTFPLLTRLGTVNSFRNGGIGDDWALINIDTQWRQWVDPNMAYLGGPSCSAWNGGGGYVKHAGHGIQTGVVVAVPRVGTAGVSNGASFQGITAVSGGDSGSALVQIHFGGSCPMGAAAGIITHCGSIGGLVCLPLYWATDIRKVPATVTTGFDPL